MAAGTLLPGGKAECRRRTPLVALGLMLTVAGGAGWARPYKYTLEERILLTRDLTAEYATARVTIPRSKKALPVDPHGKIDSERWTDAQEEYGPAARLGDLVQITKVQFKKNKIVLEINGGFRGGRKWYQRIQIGSSVGTVPIGQQQWSAARGGSKLALVFPNGVPQLRAEDVKRILRPILDFEKHSATEQYVASLPKPVQEAIRQKRAIKGMGRDAVLLALGRPVRKVRETHHGEETEDWIYGTPPGKITFVTFQGDKVIRVKVAYAGLGGSVAPPLPSP